MELLEKYQAGYNAVESKVTKVCKYYSEALVDKYNVLKYLFNIHEVLSTS